MQLTIAKIVLLQEVLLFLTKLIDPQDKARFIVNTQIRAQHGTGRR
jgi:hypothetical protein